MIGSYLTAALTSAIKAPVTTAAKVLTLALGLMVIILATGVVAYWRSADQPLNPAGDRTVIFTESHSENGSGQASSTATPYFLKRYLREDVPELKLMARLRTVGKVAVNAGGRTLTLSGASAEPDILKILHYNFVAGDPKTALQRSDGVILTQSAALRLFGSAPAMGQTVITTGELYVVASGADERLVNAGPRPMVVTGVIAALPANTLLDFDYLGAMPPDPVRPEYWTNAIDRVLAVLPADGSLTRAEVDHRLAQMVDRRKPKDGVTVKLQAVPFNRVAEMGMNDTVFGRDSGRHSVTNIMFGLASIILLVACLNYANLATAQTVGRTKEIGLRRILGASALEILVQNWIDAGLATLCALALTLMGLALAGPAITVQTDVDAMGALFSHPDALTFVGVVVAGVILAAGLYPAVLVLRVRPVDALRAGKTGRAYGGVGQVLVGLQFVSASALLIGLIVVGQQNAHARQVALRPGTDQILYLLTGREPGATGATANLLRQQLATDPRIKTISEIDRLPWTSGSHTPILARTPQAVKTATPNNELDVGFGYFAAYDQRLLAGRAFDPARDRTPDLTPSAALSAAMGEGAPEVCVVDRSFTDLLGFASPQAALEQSLYGVVVPKQPPQRVCVIIGVVEDRAHNIQAIDSRGTVFSLRPNNPRGDILVRLSASDIAGGLTAVKQAWARVAPDRPRKYQFESEIFDQNFKAFDRIGRLFVALSTTAFLISSAGLFGMAVHVTQRRLHEIGVRKALGASIGEVVGLLLADFSKPVVVANLLAWPIAYWAAKAYLAGFAQRIELTVWPFLLSLVIALAIAWLAVGGQTLKAGRVRPAEVLRDA